MNPLKLNQFVLTSVGVCADEENAPAAKRIRNKFFYLILVVMQAINITATSLYFIKFVSIDYDGAIYGLLAATVLSAMLYILITLRFHSKQLRSIFSKLDAIYKERKS